MSENQEKEQITKEEVIIEDPYRTTMVKKMQKILLLSALFQFLIGVLIYFIPLLILDGLRGMELFYPYLSIPDLPKWQALGIVSVLFTLIQIIYAIILPKLDGKPVGKYLGYVVGISMLFYLPAGTFFGLIFLQDLKDPKNPESTEAPVDLSKSISQNIISAGILTLNIPIALLIYRFILITFMLDAAYPVFNAAFMEGWELTAWIIFILALAQILIGAIYPKYDKEQWMSVLVIICGIFQIISVAIFFQFFIFGLKTQIEGDDIPQYIFYLGGPLGLFLNPIGLYLGGNIIKGQQLQRNLKIE